MKVIISPHLDDAMLSLGGSILKWISEGEQVKIINVFSKSKWLKSGLQSKSTSEIRKKEETSVHKITSAEIIFLDFEELSIRHYADIKANPEKWKEMHKQAYQTDKVIIPLIKKALLNYMSEHSEIYFPLAIGVHADHSLINEIGEELYKQYKTFFYEDLPYATHHPFPDEFVTKLKLKPRLIDITKFVSKKIELLKIYKSQLSLDKHLLPVKRYAYKFKSGKAYERVWG